MPRDVDPDKRLADVAAATVQVARTSGAHSVTIRAVATQLGGSTTLVTNYLPSRAALILNALDHGRDRWREELAAALTGVSDEDRLATVIEWSLTSTSDDPVLRTLIMEIVANAAVEPDMAASLHRESTEFRELLRSAAAESGFADPDDVAGLAYLLVRGAYIAATEDPEHWTDARIRDVIQGTVSAQPRS
ncbi:transcriptional regulator, TetR family [Microbacterium sp. cf046]|uniref:TetR/AcrR family transcriptional regulator n=1 Tax=Microbacterium sp. cf046 TaxID=1761803 RepID=UPI0008F24CAB|nr:TetR family transcriptional regulator C-terminal domain-containing protein [Microbacterium sp. cf046]SFS14203.1 transcriptional regulator, TetR family [Microbacterium sp. cf046]